jgi:hypothetical protein
MIAEQKIKHRKGELHAAKYPQGSVVTVVTLRDGRVMVSVTAPGMTVKTIDGVDHDCVTCSS